MGKSLRQTASRKHAEKQTQRLRSKVGKTKSVSATTGTKLSKTVKRDVRALLQGGQSRQKSREAVLKKSEHVVIVHKAKGTTAKARTRTLDTSLNKRRKRKHTAKQDTPPRSVPFQDHWQPSSECIWEVDPSSSEQELKDDTQTTREQKEQEKSFESTKASVHSSPSITIVDLGSGSKSGTLQTVSLCPTEKGSGKINKSREPAPSSHYQGNTPHLGTKSSHTWLEDVVMRDSKLKNFTTKERPIQSVFVVDLGNKPLSSKLSKTIRDSRSRLNPRTSVRASSARGSKRSRGNIIRDVVKSHRDKTHRREKAARDLESGIPKKDGVKRKKKMSSLDKAAKRSKKTEHHKPDLPSGQDGGAAKRKAKKKRNMSDVTSSNESAHNSKMEDVQMEENADNLVKDTDKQDEVVPSKSNLEPTQNKTDEKADLDRPDVAQDSLDTLTLRPAVSETAVDIRDPDVDIQSSSRRHVDERDDRDEASPVDLPKEQEEQTSSSSAKETITDPSFRILKLLKSDQCLVLLPRQSKFSFHGRVLVRSLHGSVTVLGFLITPSPDLQFYPLYSPSSSCALCLETLSGCPDSVGASSPRSLVESLDAFLSMKGETEIAESLQGLEGRFSVALIFKMSEDRSVDYVERFPGFGNLFSSPEPKEYAELDEAWTSNLTAAASVGFQPTTPNTPGAVFNTLPDYPTVSKSINHWLHATDVMPVVLVCGWKNTGKSTLCRYLINSIIPSVGSICYLECDMAQTEFTSPGMLSLQHVTQPLLGPPFTHSREAEKLCFYGDVNVRGDPESYLQMVKHLFRQYQTGHLNKPLIINTMGWMQGLGLQLLIDIVHMTRPTHIVQLWSPIQPRLIEKLTPEFLEQTAGWWHRPVPEHDGNGGERPRALCPEILEVDVPNIGDQSGTKHKASDHRTMALLACLTELQPTPLPPEPVALSSLTPLVLPWRSVAVHVTNGHVSPRQVLYALNGSLVGLCQADPAKMLSVSEDLPRVFDSTPVCQCLGLGIVRGIDPVQKIFYILTGVSQHALREVNTLLKGSLTLPQPLLTQGHHLTDVPYISREFSSVIIGSGAIKVRRNIKQRGR